MQAHKLIVQNDLGLHRAVKTFPALCYASLAVYWRLLPSCLVLALFTQMLLVLLHIFTGVRADVVESCLVCDRA